MWRCRAEPITAIAAKNLVRVTLQDHNVFACFPQRVDFANRCHDRFSVVAIRAAVPILWQAWLDIALLGIIELSFEIGQQLDGLSSVIVRDCKGKSMWGVGGEHQAVGDF